MKSIKEAGNLTDKKVIVRTDWNVPVENGQVTDTSRILASLETIKFILDAGGSVIVISHFGRSGDSLEPVFQEFSHIIPAVFVKNPFNTEDAAKITNLKPGEVAVIENIRKWPEEESNDESFAKRLADLGDLYVNEAFSNSHREHASIVGIPKFLPHFAGFGLTREVENLDKAFNPPHPFLFILGGAKFDTKLPLIEKFLSIADFVFVGGALANDLFKARGLNVGQSVVSEGIDVSSFAHNPKINIPIDIETDTHHFKKLDEVENTEKIYDAGPETIKMLAEKINNAKFVLWNGPLGDYEKGFNKATEELAKILGTSKAETIIGGGDTLAAIKNLKIEKEFTFLSTAGGAMLEFLANGTLPGIEALK